MTTRELVLTDLKENSCSEGNPLVSEM
jgi:hypothetical protein